MPLYATTGLNMDMGIPSSDPATWLPVDPTAIPDFPEFADLGDFSQSQPSSAYSGSPAHSDVSLPVGASQPQSSLHDHTSLSFEAWQEGATQMHGAPTTASVPDMVSQVGIGLDGLFDGPFGIEANNGAFALGFKGGDDIRFDDYAFTS